MDCDIDHGPTQRWLNLNTVGPSRSALVVRCLKFNAVGAIGIAVQLSALTLLVRVFRLPIVLATGLAVEIAVVHNFVWHRGWTWADRRGSPVLIEALRVLFRFNLTTGLVSLLGNMFFMRLLVAAGGLGLLRSNLLTIAICSLVNFVISDRWVFVGGLDEARSVRGSSEPN